MKSVFAALIFSLLAGAAHAQTLPLQRFTITYVIHARGLDVGEADYNFTFQGNAYQATSSRRATGMVRMLAGASQDFTYSARGDIGADGVVHPSAYQHQGGKGHRVVQVSFPNGVATTIARPPMGMGNPPASIAQKTGVADQVSMFAQMLIAQPDPCRQVLHVFMDGRTRFDLSLTPAGRQSVSLAGFRGQAQHCAVQFTPIAGFSDPLPATQLTFLMAPVNGYYVPLVVEMPTNDAGIVRLEARRFTLTGSR